jgi:hypothetical protein
MVYYIFTHTCVCVAADFAIQLLVCLYVGVFVLLILLYAKKVLREDLFGNEFERLPHCLKEKLDLYRGALADLLSREMSIIESTKRTSLGMISLVGLTLTMSFGIVMTLGKEGSVDTFMILGITFSVVSLFLLMMALLHPVGLGIAFSTYNVKGREETKNIIGKDGNDFLDCLVIYEIATLNDTKEQRRVMEMMLIAGECTTVLSLILIVFAILSYANPTADVMTQFGIVMGVATVFLVVFFVYMFALQSHTSKIAKKDLEIAKLFDDEKS